MSNDNDNDDNDDNDDKGLKSGSLGDCMLYVRVVHRDRGEGGCCGCGYDRRRTSSLTGPSWWGVSQVVGFPYVSEIPVPIPKERNESL